MGFSISKVGIGESGSFEPEVLDVGLVRAEVGGFGWDGGRRKGGGEDVETEGDGVHEGFECPEGSLVFDGEFYGKEEGRKEGRRERVSLVSFGHGSGPRLRAAI